MRMFIAIAVIVLIPLISCFIRNIFRYKKNLPVENNFCGRLVEKMYKKK